MRASTLTLALLLDTARAAPTWDSTRGGVVVPYLDPSLSAHDRAEDLLQRMAWEEKVGQLGGIRRVVSRVDGEPVFNRTSFEAIRKTQNGQIGKQDTVLLGCRKGTNLNDNRLGYATQLG